MSVTPRASAPAPRDLAATAAAALLTLALGGCGAAQAGPQLALPRAPAALPASSRSHFVVLVLENRELGEVIGDPSAPYVNSLARSGALALDYHAVAHPSLPNYISLLAGDPLGIDSDCSECVAHGTTLVDQLDAAHVGWRAYMEGMPHPCYKGASAGGYAKKHDPFMYFPQVVNDPTRCSRVVPLTALAADLRSGSLPAFAWITPNLCDDGHDCANGSVDRFARHLVPYLLRALGRNGVLAIVWDEGASNSGCCARAAGGRVPLILLGAPVRAGARVTVAADHYSLLALVEDAFALRRLRSAACACTPSLREAFRGSRPPALGRG